MSSRSPSTVSSAVRRIAAGSTCRPRNRELAARQRVLLEHHAHRLEIELGRQVGDREVFLVESARRLGLCHVAAHEVVEQRAERGDMALQVHAHERAELHEARVDARAARPDSARARALIRLRSNQSIGLRRGELVDPGRADAAVDRPGHQRQAAPASAGSSSSDISAAAASAATQGWQIAIRCEPGPDHAEELDQVLGCTRPARSGRPPAARRARCASR